MSKSKKLVATALSGLFATSMLVSAPSFAAEETKAACNGKDATKTEKSNCKTAEGKDKNACKGKDKNACKGKAGCSTEAKKTEADKK